MKSFLKRYRPLGALLTTLFLLCVLVVGSFAVNSLGPVAIAQPTPIRRISPVALSTQIYQQIPDLPLENQYISSETGAAVPENTLISRLIRYHVYLKNRPTVFRLDWKLTLADYLGAFERMSPADYPDYGLRENPYANDIDAIESLSPEQRNLLVNTLYEVFTTPQSAEASSESSSEPVESVEPAELAEP